mmetsp:Transcript_32213/g.74147  ORF Transcript_32213/g.74147 Transcript_32213/m.74147 type:complete len:143 (-) Transcript_32213:267-695(-)
MLKVFVLVACVAFASAFSPAAAPSRVASSNIQMSRFDGKVWTMDAKITIMGEWDPEETRGYNNFNAFERDDQGNCCDANGKFPGEGNYKDPKRPDTNWESMTRDRETMVKVNADPKMAIKGKKGNWKRGWDKTLGMIPAEQL